MSHPTTAIETRSIDQSLSAAHQLMGRAEYVLGQLHSEVTGYETGETDPGNPIATGLVNGADALAGRLESFVASLERTRARIIAPNVVSVGQAMKSQIVDRGFG